MYTVGQLLKEERIRKGFTVEQIEKATKIRAKFIIALEAEDYAKLPNPPYTQGFIKNYGDFLGLRSNTLLALFRRQWAAKNEQKKKILEEPLTQSKWMLTPNKVIAGLVTLLVSVLFAYFFSQYQLLHRPPPLLVENPKTDETTQDERIAVFGKTDADATLMINKEPVLIKEGGKFYKNMDLTIGGNTLIIESSNRVGEKTTVTRRITRVTN